MSTSSSQPSPTPSSTWLRYPLDKAAGISVVILTVVIAIVILVGDHASPQVREFTWGDRQIGAEDTAFILTFNRPMDRDSVEANLAIEPGLPGKFSWAGRRMAYTLDFPAPYGKEFTVSLTEARDRFTTPEQPTPPIQPFQSTFRSRDRAFAYLGTAGEERGRLVLENLTQQTHQILTPKDLTVLDFEFYPLGDRILFSAIRQDEAEGVLAQRLYTVTTGLPHTDTTARSFWPWSAAANNPPTIGEITLVLDSDTYQNLKFDLSPDGELIVVQRINRNDPTDFGPWLIREDEPAAPIETDPGGDFLITPDSSTLVLAQGEGLAILPLQPTAPGTAGSSPDSTEPLDFLPRFGMVLNFAPDGTAAAMIKFNTDFTRSLFLVTNQGQEEELIRTEGSILGAQFAPSRRYLYVLATRLLPGDDFIEQPLIIAIDLETKTQTNLLLLPVQKRLQMSLAPDGLGLLFDQTVTADTVDQLEPDQLVTEDGNLVAESELWFLPLAPTPDGILITEAEPLGIAGISPKWLP